jgi:hypothetical protein
MIGQSVRENALKRFENFKTTFGFSNEFVNKHQQRYEILDRFFKEYNKQAPSYKFGGKDPNGYCGVIEMFICILNNKFTLRDICMETSNYSIDPIIHNYFENLDNEMHL